MTVFLNSVLRFFRFKGDVMLLIAFVLFGIFVSECRADSLGFDKAAYLEYISKYSIENEEREQTLIRNNLVREHLKTLLDEGYYFNFFLINDKNSRGELNYKGVFAKYVFKHSFLLRHYTGEKIPEAEEALAKYSKKKELFYSDFNKEEEFMSRLCGQGQSFRYNETSLHIDAFVEYMGHDNYCNNIILFIPQTKGFAGSYSIQDYYIKDVTEQRITNSVQLNLSKIFPRENALSFSKKYKEEKVLLEGNEPISVKSTYDLDSENLRVKDNEVILTDDIDLIQTEVITEQTAELVQDSFEEKDAENIPGQVSTNEQGNIVGFTEQVTEYASRSWDQFWKGNYSDEVTVLGTAAQIGASFTGLDMAMDIRDLTHDIQNWEWSVSHVSKTALDAVGLVPVLGAVKNVDEFAVLAKNGFEIVQNGGLKALLYGTTSKIVKSTDEVLAVTVKTVKNLPKFKWTQKLDNHIFKGDLVKDGTRWKASGVHHISATNSGKVRLTGAKTDLGNGFYKSKVEIYDEDFYKYEMKDPRLPETKKGWKTKKDESTFFPDSWSKEKIKKNIMESYNSLYKENNRYFGKTRGGIRIEFLFDDNMNIVTVFPNIK